MNNTSNSLVKSIEGIRATSVKTINPPNLIANNAVLVEASNDNFLVHIDRSSLVSMELRRNVNLTPLEGKSISLTLEPMDLNISGYVVKTYMLGNGKFAMDLNFSHGYSNYFRECLFDLLPGTFEKSI